MKPIGLETIVELSGIQRGILAECLAAEESAMYQVQSSFRLVGELDVPAMTRAWQVVVARHQALRCSFFWEGLSVPVQAVHRNVTVPVRVVDGEAQPVAEVRAADRRTPFDLRRPPHLRVTLVRLSPREHELVWTRHHLQMDGWSQVLVLGEVFRLYEAFRTIGTDADLDDVALLGPRTELGPYITWLRAERHDDPALFWRPYLAGLRPATRFGTEPLAREQAELRSELSIEMTERIIATARAWSVTPASVYEAAWALTLAAGDEHDEAVFGVTVSTRPPTLATAERMVGLYINTLPARVPLDPDRDLQTLARAVHDHHVRLLDWQQTSLAEVSALSPVRPPGRLFDSLVVVGNYPAAVTAGDPSSSLTVKSVVGEVQNSIPLTLRVMPGAPTAVALLYDTGALSAGTAAEYHARYLTALEAMVAAEPVTVGAVWAALAPAPTDLEVVAAAVRPHPAVAEAAVVRSGPGAVRVAVVPGGGEGDALLRSLRAEPSAGERFELPDGMVVAHDDATMTRHLYREIVVDEGYLRGGIELADGAVVLDVGANIGLFTIWVATRWRDVRVYAYEPVPETAVRARWNAAMWAPGAVVENAGLGERTGTAAFVHYPRLSGASGRFADPDRDASGLAALALAQTADGRAEPGDADYVRARLSSRWATRTYQCPVTTVSAEVARHGIDRIDLLKIDAEGSELDVLAGIDADDWTRIGQVVLEAHGAELRHSAEAVLREHGFHVSAQRVGFYEHTEVHNVFAVRPHRVRRGHPPRRTLVSAAELAEQVRARLAGVGSRVDAVLVLPELPRSATGALDKAALAEGPGDASRAALRHEPPATALEDVIALVWRQLLHDRDMIGRHDNFFGLGGHSLLAIRCTSRLRSLLPAAIPLGLLFEHPTIAGLADALRDSLPDPDTLDRAAALVVQVAAMSDAEVDAALAADAVPERTP